MRSLATNSRWSSSIGTARGPCHWPDGRSRSELGASGRLSGRSCWDHGMSSRYLPYATTPGRLLAQLVSDPVVVSWTAVRVFVGLAVHSAVATIAEVGRQVNAANGVAGNLNSAGDKADDVPLVGDALSKPLGRPARRRTRHRGRGRASTRRRPGWRGCWHWQSPHRPSWRRDAVAVHADPVLPPQVGGDHARGHPGRRTAARAARPGRPPAGRAGGVSIDPVGA